MSAVLDYLSYLYNIPHNFSANSSRKLLDAYPDYPAYAAVLYVTMVFFLPGYLKRNGKVYHLMIPSALWNLSLSLISFVGAYYADTLIYDFVFVDRGFHKTCCEILQFPDGSQFGVNIKDLSRKGAEQAATRQAQHMSEAIANNGHSEIVNRGFYGASSFYVTLFMYLKTPELLDTLFLILQGKPVSFLHWFHHVLTAIYCWHASYALIPSGLFFVAMNYTVHAVMYFYFFLVVIGLRKKIRWFAPFITLMQVSQMFVGMYITCYTYFQYWLGPDHEGELFYRACEIVFSAWHQTTAQFGSLAATGRLLPSEAVAPFHMRDRFFGCETDATNLRMGVMMYGAYCVLFGVLFKELYIAPKKSGKSLVRVHRAEADEASPSAAVANGASPKLRKEKRASNEPSSPSLTSDSALKKAESKAPRFG